MAGAVIPSRANTLRGLKGETELWALIAAMERVAFESYRQLALLMARQGNNELEKLFRDIAEEERRQEQEAASRMGSRVSSPRITRLATELGLESFTSDELEDAGGVHAMTPHSALSLAIRNEERAFLFFSEIVAVCADASLRAVCGRIAKEERAHLVSLRLARQQLYRPANTAAPVAEPTPLVDIEEASALRVATTGLALRELAVAVTGADCHGVAEFLVTLADQIERPAQALAHPNAPLTPGPMPPQQALLHALARLEEDFGFFSHLFDVGLEGAVWRLVLGHVETTVERIALVRTRLSV
jgi:rubrerythrin